MASVTTPQGFSAAATAAGIKPSGKSDMALVVNEGPQWSSAAVFTQNRVFAAPVRVTREAVAHNTLKAVVYNAGNANACTGAPGVRDAEEMQQLVAQAVGLETQEVGVCSTGLIGEPLPMDKIRAGISTLSGDLGPNGEAAAQAIMTTDTIKKQSSYKSEGWTVAAMGKGVGMMAPSLATMLVLITTDAVVSNEQLDAALKNSTPSTFDAIDIDGSTSTNDTVIALASGASGIEPDAQEFATAIYAVCKDIAEQMQADAEGVTKRVTVRVTGTGDNSQARNAARTVARDNLFKCAMFGSDPNWGRVLAAVGMADADMDADNIAVSFNGHSVCEKSTAVPGARDVDLSGVEIDVHIDLGTGGTGEAVVRTTDLSHAYVEINSAYSS